MKTTERHEQQLNLIKQISCLFNGHEIRDILTIQLNLLAVSIQQLVDQTGFEPEKAVGDMAEGLLLLMKARAALLRGEIPPELRGQFDITEGNNTIN